MENSVLRDTLSQMKSAGYSPADAVRQLQQADNAVAAVKAQDPSSFGNLNMATQAQMLSNALLHAYALTPLELAQALKIYEDDIQFVAIGVASGFPDMKALDIAKLLLDPTLYPNADRNTMYNALVAAGFSTADSSAAVNALYPATTVTVQAKLSWQDSGVVVGNEPVTITYQGGQWFCSPMGGMVNAAGSPQFIAKPGYTLPGAPEGALIGKVGGTAFLVGLGTTVPAGLTGSLLFCINDDLDQRYGAGLVDNFGSVIVSVS
jgi:hypothetical protein